MIESWLLPTLALLPVLLGVFLAVGVPWAFAILPRADWPDRMLIGVTGLALGVIGLTAGMFVLGTFAIITVANTVFLGGLLMLAGALLALGQARRTTPVPRPSSPPLAGWEWLIIIGVLVTLVLRTLRVAYWPFTAYDALWVYGYNARAFTLTGQIPADMGYYPQLVPLTYTFAQQVWGGINDHAARAVIPIFAAGSSGAAYLLGRQLVSRRAGLITLLLWAFYPHHVDWGRFGDLEVPLTFFYTLAGLFFLLAWRADDRAQESRTCETPMREYRARWCYAVMAGLMLGGAMWTKPTAGALVWGIGLVLLLEAVRSRTGRSRTGRTRLDWPHLWLKLRLILVVGLACVPVGGMWYIRNIVLGHPALVFPPSYWLTQAQRSGQQFLWPLVVVGLVTVLLLLPPRHDQSGQRAGQRAEWRLLIPGLLLMLAGLLPTTGWPRSLIYDIPTRRMLPLEVGLLLVGALLYGAGLWRWWRAGGQDRVAQSPDVRARLDLALLSGALVLPYWFTWFWSYSYHSRLAFAIMPLILLIVALLIMAVADRLATYSQPQTGRLLVYGALLLVILPVQWFAIGGDTLTHWIAADLENDNDKHLASNYALMRTVNELVEDFPEVERPIKIAAPGALRLPFFFPELPVDTSPITDLYVLDDGFTYFIDGREAENAYNTLGQPVNQVRGAMGLRDLAKPIFDESDADFSYEIYRVDTARRHEQPGFNGYPLALPVVYPGLAEVLGSSMSTGDFWVGRGVILNIVFHVTGTVAEDYQIFLHVTDGENVVATWDHGPGNGQYNTSLWEQGEYIEDQLWVQLMEDVPPGTYHVLMGLYNAETGERLPVQVGAEIRDSFLLVDGINQLYDEPAQ
ncbi:ArnT family glycosyltransferase [Chloroflexota bacterium]